jgi:hypothetical protein
MLLPLLYLLLLLHHDRVLVLDALLHLLALLVQLIYQLRSRLHLPLRVLQLILHFRGFRTLIRPRLFYC